MNHIVGNIGEKAAVSFLQRAGYKILEHNFRTKSGEIDIIAEYCHTIIFIEVKTRRSTVFGFPAEAVTRVKQHRIIKTALYYLNVRNHPDSSCRFDVLEVFLQKDGSFKYNHIIDAFGQ